MDSISIEPGKLISPSRDDRRTADRGSSSGTRAITGDGGLQLALGTISQLALRPIEPAEFVALCAETVARSLAVEQAAVFELSADKKLLSLSGGFDWPRVGGPGGAVPTAACRPFYLALSVEDAVELTAADLHTLRGIGPTGSGIALPIGERESHAGVLAILATDATRHYSPGEISFLRTVAFIVAAVWERHQAQALLMLRNRALEALDQGIMITDARRVDNPLIYVNPAFERLTGYPAHEVMGRNPRFLQGQGTDRQMVGNLRMTVQSGEPFRGSVLNYRRDGTPFWNDLAISAVRGTNGAATHYVGVFADVTERMRLEAQLRQAQKMEAIGHLTGGIAHDFNNLLAVILGNSEILLEEAIDDSMRETVHLVVGTAERGAILTQRLLAFGRRQALRPEPVEVGEALSTLAEMLQRTLGEQVRLVTEDDGTGTNAMADRAMFESAIVNLAVNARDAMPQGGQLTIRSRVVAVPQEVAVPELHAGSYACVSVEDTGTGMPPEVLAKVFEPFFTTKEVGKGSGLGLPMVYGFTRQSGGQVTIDSRVGRGTTVNLYLPVASERPERRERTRTDDDPVPVGTERILLVEDEREVRRFVSRVLGRLGYGVLEAEDASGAIGILERNEEIDLLFSDLILPGGLNGLKLVETARTIRPNLKVLLTTGYTEEYERIAKASPGLILRKPYRRQQLAHSLRRVLDATVA